MKTIKKLISTVVGLVIICGFLLGFIQLNNIQSAGDFIRYGRLKGAEISRCVNQSLNEGKIKCDIGLKVGSYAETQEEADSINNEYGTHITVQNTTANDINTELGIGVTSTYESSLQTMSATKMTKESAERLLESIQTVDKYDDVKYNRKDWKHWSAQNGNTCWNTREQALYNQGKDVVLLDKNKKETTDINKACYIKSGVWVDPYSGETFTKPGDLDVDHTVPLNAAAKMGAQSWSPEQKEIFANDLQYVLVVTSAKQNRAKGAKTPSEWMPEKQEAHCDYAKIYLEIVNKYKMNLTQADKDALAKALKTCKV
jgi:secreted protein